MSKAKTPNAPVNEVLCKILCHNICFLIESWYELGIEPIFGVGTVGAVGTFGTKEAVVPKMAWE